MKAIDILLSDFAWYRKRRGGTWTLEVQPDCSWWSSGIEIWRIKE